MGRAGCRSTDPALCSRSRAGVRRHVQYQHRARGSISGSALLVSRDHRRFTFTFDRALHSEEGSHVPLRYDLLHYDLLHYDLSGAEERDTADVFGSERSAL